jgi:hypothetical protein
MLILLFSLVSLKVFLFATISAIEYILILYI